MTKRRSYQSAQEICRNLGGDLAVLKTKAFATKVIASLSSLQSGSHFIYFGLKRVFESWRWVDEIPLLTSSSNWEIGKPTTGQSTQ